MRQAHIAERVQVAVPRPHPIVVLDGELEGAVGGSEHRVLIDAEKVVDVADLRNRGLTDADGADGVRLHNVDVEALAHGTAEDCRAHPPRSAAAYDHHTPDA